MNAFIAFLDAFLFSIGFLLSIKANFGIQLHNRFWDRVTLDTKFKVNLVWNLLQSFSDFLTEFLNCSFCSYYVHRKTPLPSPSGLCDSTSHDPVCYRPRLPLVVMYSAGLCAVPIR